MHEKTHEFLVLFNDFEKALKDRLNKVRHEPFSAMVREEGRRNALIRKHKAFLLDVADLRNVLVHTEDETFMAVPSDEALTRLRKVYESYTKARTVLDICSGKPWILKPGASLREALLVLKKRDISQVPVYDGRQYLGTVTGNTVTRWMLAHMDDEGVLDQDLDNTTAENLLSYSEQRDRAVFVPRNKDLNELLMEVGSYDKPVAAFIVTEHGRSDEAPLGVFTYGALAYNK